MMDNSHHFNTGTDLTTHFNEDKAFPDVNNGHFKQPERILGATGSDRKQHVFGFYVKLSHFPSLKLWDVYHGNKGISEKDCFKNAFCCIQVVVRKHPTEEVVTVSKLCS